MTWGFEWQHNGQPSLRVQIADVRLDGDAIFADITVWWLYDQAIGVRPIQPMTVLKLNNSHYTGWRNIAKVLQHDKNAPLPDVDIDAAMTIAVSDVLEAFVKGEPTIDLGMVEAPREDPFILEPWISAAGATVMYGEGGLSKSLLALAMALSVSTGVPIFGKEPNVVGPVMYFDYEDDHYTHVNRLAAMCRAFGIPQEKAGVKYHALTAKVSQSKREMASRVAETGAVLGILDSVGMGRGGSAIAAEDTIRMFRGLREVGVPFLAIDHVSKADKGKAGGDVDAYGSIYTMNSARLAWSLTRQDSKGEALHIHAINRKANHVRKANPQTIAITYHNDERGVPERIDIETGNEFGMILPSVGAREKILMLLDGGEEWTYADLAEQLGISTVSARKAVSDDKLLDEPQIATRKDGRTVMVRSVNHTSSHMDSHISEEDESA